MTTRIEIEVIKQFLVERVADYIIDMVRGHPIEGWGTFCRGALSFDVRRNAADAAGASGLPPWGFVFHPSVESGVAYTDEERDWVQAELDRSVGEMELMAADRALSLIPFFTTRPNPLEDRLREHWGDAVREWVANARNAR